MVLIVGLKFFDLSDAVHTFVAYITYNMGNWDLPDIYAYALGLGHIYQTNPSCPCYNLYIINGIQSISELGMIVPYISCSSI